MPAETHQSVGKESGETAHMERWYCTLRQWLGRYTRRTLSFSKTDFYHWLVTSWFITHHNIQDVRGITYLTPTTNNFPHRKVRAPSRGLIAGKHLFLNHSQKRARGYNRAHE
jgi:hypothetical protein